MSGYEGEGTGGGWAGDSGGAADVASLATAADFFAGSAGYPSTIADSAPTGSPVLADPFTLSVVGRSSELGLVGREVGAWDFGRLFDNALTALGGLLSLSAGGPAGAMGAGRAARALSNAPSAYDSRRGFITFEAPGFGSPAPNLGSSSAPGLQSTGERAIWGAPVLDDAGRPIRMIDRPGFAPAPGRALEVANAARAQRANATTSPPSSTSSAAGLAVAGLAAFALLG